MGLQSTYFSYHRHLSLNMAVIMPKCCRPSCQGVVVLHGSGHSLLNMAVNMPRGCRLSCQGTIMQRRQSTSITEHGSHHLRGCRPSCQGDVVLHGSRHLLLNMAAIMPRVVHVVLRTQYRHVGTLAANMLSPLLLSCRLNMLYTDRQSRPYRVVVGDSHIIFLRKKIKRTKLDIVFQKQQFCIMNDKCFTN